MTPVKPVVGLATSPGSGSVPRSQVTDHNTLAFRESGAATRSKSAAWTPSESPTTHTGTSGGQSSRNRSSKKTIYHTPKTPVTPSLRQSDRERSSVANLRDSFEKLGGASPQKLVRQFSLDSHKQMSRESGLRARERSSTMPEQSLTRRGHEAPPSSSGDNHAFDEPASPAMTQPAQQTAGTGRDADLFSWSQTQKYLSDVHANAPTAVPSLANNPTRPVREPSLVQGESQKHWYSLRPGGPAVPASKSHTPPFSSLHPFLRQQNSATNKLEKLAAADNMDVKSTTEPDKSQDVKTQEELPPQHPHHHTFTKVGNLRKFYDVPSATLPFYPFRRRQEMATAEGRAVSGVFVSSASPDLVEHDNAAEEFCPRRSATSVGKARNEGLLGSAPEDSARRSRNKLRKKKHQPTLKEKVSMFESLNRPPSRLQLLRARAKSFETTAVLKRGGEEVTSGLKKMAENGTRMWRRLSGSFDKEREKHKADAIDQQADSPDKPSSFKVLSSDIDQHKTYPQPRPPIVPPRRNPRRESTFLLTEPTSRIPRAVAYTYRPRASVPNNSNETSDSSTSEVRDFAVDGNTEVMRLRPRTSRPVLPTLDFDVDGLPDMLRYFERSFDINLSVHARGSTMPLGSRPHQLSSHDSRHRSTVTTPRRLPDRDSRSTNRSSQTSSISRPSVKSYSNVPTPAVPPRHPGHTRGPGYDSPSTLSRKSHRASPVLSIREARGDTRARHRPPDSARRRRKPAMSSAGASHQRIWDVRRDTPRLGVVRSEEEMIYTAKPAGQHDEEWDRGKRAIQPSHERPVILAEQESATNERRQDENVVVAEAQCRLAHPKPSRVLNLKRFVEFVREKSGALGKL